jgi:glycerophosphoryl diester phosphodiesterase
MASTNAVLKLEFAAGKDSIVEGPSRPDALQMKDSLVIPLVTKKFIERAHRVNLPVHAWTVNDISGMQLMINLGVDGIITDYPGPLKALLER